MREITFQKVLEESQYPTAKLGEVALTPDGRQWRYVKANEALSLGSALTRKANVDVDTVSSANDGDGNTTLIKEGSAGWTAGAYADAYGLVDDGTGQGQFFKIRTNSTDTLRLFTEYALSTALEVASSDIVIVTPHLVEKTAVTVLNQIPVGVAQVAFTSAYYGYVLERGIGAVLAGEALTANELCTSGDNTEGEVLNIDSGETPDDVSTFGRCLVANTTADKGAVIDVNVL